MLVQTLIPQAVWISYLLRRNFPHSREVQIHRLRLCHYPSLFHVAFLSSLGHGTLLPDRIRKKMAEMAARKHREIHYVQQSKKMIPFITFEIYLWSECQRVVNIFDLDLGVQFDSDKRPIQRNSVGSGNMSHCRASSL